MSSIIRDKRVYLLQLGLKSLGFDPGTPDGIEGKNTKSAFDRWEDSLTKKESSPSLGIATIPAMLIRIATTQIGIREVTKNNGDGIAKYWSATSYLNGYANREPYCAAFICWLVREAVGGKKVLFSLPKSPVAYDIESWGLANKNKGVSVLNNLTQLKAGDIFTLKAASHVGLISSVSASVVQTIEANTNGAGSREGDGVYARTRTIASLRKIVRITA